MEQFENTEDILDWVDNYSLNYGNLLMLTKKMEKLRGFRVFPTENGITSKSNENYENPDNVIGLYRAKGKTSATGAMIKILACEY